MCYLGWVVLLVLWIGLIGTGLAADCLQPAVTSIFPPEVQVGGPEAVRMIRVAGVDLGFDPVWGNPAESSRCRSQVWVRRSEEDDSDWTVVDPETESGGVSIGDRGGGWARVDLEGEPWLAETGLLELMVVKVILSDDGSARETARSSVHEVAVVDSIGYGLEIQSLVPRAVSPGSPGTLLVLEGSFTWGSEVLLDDKVQGTAVIKPGDGRAEVWVSAEQLRSPGSFVVRLRDEAGATSGGVLFLVETPTAIGKVSPGGLTEGQAGQTVKVRFDGAEPERVDVLFQPAAGTVRQAGNPEGEDFSEGFSRGNQAQTPSGTTQPVFTAWTPLEFRIRKKEVRLTLGSGLTPGPGVLILRLTSRTGEVAAVIPIEAASTGPATMPSAGGGIPESKIRGTDRPKY